MESFKRMIDDCALLDLGYEGIKFTWWNNREGVNAIHERLDRALANNAWCRAFPYAKVFHTFAAYSDHNPIVLQTEGCVQKFKGQKPFRFEAVWTKSEECGKVIEKAWQVHCGNGPIREVVNKILRCSDSFLRWNKASFGTVQKRLKMARVQLEKIQAENLRNPNRAAVQQAREEVQIWLKREEIL
ncbi:uncharacterized protein LOC122278695 [Carya illinoinensis]|uniref:uncharacterized protein LOC122278695 n=1 Tax=Carya illinoinensis TaxID=32201 RepID=UPI001C724F40|nr:uncharacterized protein LOC122278695 [Carya illinoinensis]